MFVLDCQARRLSAKTLRNYRQQLAAFLAYMQEHSVKSLTEVTPTHLRALFVDMQERELSEDTQATMARIVRAFLNFAVNEELITTSPVHKVKLPRPSKRILPAFTPDDVKKLLAVCKSPRDTAMMLCLLDSGCRAAEFVALNVGDVDRKIGAVRIVCGKGKKDRVTFLGSKAHKALIKYLITRPDTQPADPLWLSETHHGERLSQNGLNLLLRRLGVRANVEHCHPHTFRRTFALWSLRAGMDLISLSRIMGHEDLTVLRRYLALVQEDLEDQHRKHGTVEYECCSYGEGRAALPYPPASRQREGVITCSFQSRWLAGRITRLFCYVRDKKICSLLANRFV